MTILLTGATRVQLDTLKGPRRLQIGMIPSLIYDQLQNYDAVDRRAVNVGESLDDYDAVWVCVSPLTSLKCQFGLGMTWAMYEAYRKGIPLVVYFDDWQTNIAFNAYRSLVRYPKKTITKVVGGKYLYMDDIAETERRLDQFVELGDLFAEKRPAFWDRVAVAFPKYRHWGETQVMDRYLQLPEGTSMGYDPSFLMSADIANAIRPEGPKKRRWMFATLVPHEKGIKSLKITWPLDYYGPKKFKSPLLKTEQAVLEKNMEYWGAISRVYQMDGAGWWRRRYAFAAAAGTVLLTGSPAASEMLGPAYQVSGPYVESLSDSELRDLADRQAETFFTGYDPSYESSAEEVGRILERAQQNARVLV